jgi:spermidine synthase
MDDESEPAGDTRTSAGADSPGGRSRPALFYAGVFLITAATLMLQVIETRILSVVSWYHLAFFVISVAMFGLTSGAVWVYLRGERFTPATLSWDLAYFSAALAVATALSGAAQLTLSPTLAPRLVGLLVWAELALCIAVPFFFSGVVISLALTRSPFPVGRVYGVDLAGAAAGCLGVLAVLNATDAPSAVLWSAALTAVAAVAFSASRVGAAPARRPAFAALLERRRSLLIVLVASALANGLSEQGLRLVFVKGFDESSWPKLFEAWNSFSRVAVYAQSSRIPQMWGASPRFEPARWHTEQRTLNIDGDAATATYRINGDSGKAGFLRYDVTNLAYFLPELRRAGIIGVGGGRDVMSARVFGVPDIIGVEINPILVRLLVQTTGFADYADLRRLGGVSFHIDEARSWFARSRDTFDVIQMSLVDTWAATGAGAFTLSENGLYTLEAWRIFLGRLAKHGVFTVSRWYESGEVDETARMIGLAMAVLLESQAREPTRHIFVAASGSIATLVLGRAPLTPSQLAALRRAATEMRYTVLVDPDTAPPSSVISKILASPSADELDRATDGLELDLTVPTDDRPFFFNQFPLRELPRLIWKPELAQRHGIIYKGNLLATVTLGMLFVVAATLVVATIVIPLRPALRHVGPRLAMAGTAYFMLIGVGFMCIEIGLLQRMSVFLGHPIYSLSIVLFAMILATGLGSFLSERVQLARRASFAAWAVVTAGYLCTLPLTVRAVAHTFDSSSLPVRASLAVALIAPAGLLMGWGFPTGIRLIAAVDARPTPWFWGINGAAGVFASILAVAVSMALGISATLVIGAACYALLIPAAFTIGFAAERK